MKRVSDVGQGLGHRRTQTQPDRGMTGHRVPGWTGGVKGLPRVKGRGFTLVEVLVVVGILALLAGLVLPSVASSRRAARKVQCVGNLRQLSQASLVYAEDDSRRSLSGRTEIGDSSLGYLSLYLRQTRSFTCPSTRNTLSARTAPNRFTGVVEPVDMQDLAYDREATHGLSYLGHAFIGSRTPYSCEVPQGIAGTRVLPYLRKTLDVIGSYEKYHDVFGLGGVQPGPSRFWLVVDNYWLGRVPAYPDDADNHGAAGLHVSYCDGHVEWVPTRGFLYQYELDADDGRTGIPLPPWFGSR